MRKWHLYPHRGALRLFTAIILRWGHNMRHFDRHGRQTLRTHS